MTPRSHRDRREEAIRFWLAPQGCTAIPKHVDADDLTDPAPVLLEYPAYSIGPSSHHTAAGLGHTIADASPYSLDGHTVATNRHGLDLVLVVVNTSDVALSIVVIAYNMDRELPRTLHSLAPGYQRGIDSSQYEVIVVDNGSTQPLDEAMLASFPGHLRSVRLDPASPSPAHAANVGLDMARGEFVGLLIDGARLASPGLLHQSLVAKRVADRPVVATLAWHLGHEPHMRADEVGYDQDGEDRLLDEVDWKSDGYRLFRISTLAGSSRRGWFGQIDESNALFMDHSMWKELGGLDERFALPGGGAVNHDLYRRACGLEESFLIVLLGEGTFHQIHGGALTSRRYPREWALSEYETLRGVPLEVTQFDPLYLGTVPTETLPHLEYSVRWAINERRT